MKAKKLMATTASAVLLFAASQQVLAKELKTLTERASYVFGYQIAKRFQQDQVELDADAFAAAIHDAQKDKDPRMSEEEMMSTMRQLQDMQMAKHNEAMQVVAEANQKEGEAYLEKNAKKDGVVTTDSGLQYTVLTKGKGPKPDSNSTVTVHYRGTLLDGTEFDSSYSRGEPTSFGVNQVIPGWTEALLLMSEGAKWEVIVPAELAYGAGGAGGDIGPNATLKFEIELLSIDD